MDVLIAYSTFEMITQIKLSSSNQDRSGHIWDIVDTLRKRWKNWNCTSESVQSVQGFSTLIYTDRSGEWKPLTAVFPRLEFCPVNQILPLWPNGCSSWEIDLSFIKGGTLYQHLQNLETVIPRLSSLSLEVFKKSLVGEAREGI